ncbi:MAG: FkbM family methyltransferase [Mucilaginibacter polytrichastri]|nr:FkbM family methyltransferase [Mucilaginibacter polytrichastri]
MNALQRTLGYIYYHPLASRNLFSAYRRLVWWQIRSRLSSDLVPVPFISGTKLLAKKRLVGMTGNIYTGLADFEEMGFLLHFLRPGDIFYDVGANVGSYSILASGVCFARTVAFEPGREAFDILRKNINLNFLSDKITPVYSAVGNKQTSLLLTSDEDATNHVVDENASEKKTLVDCMPLDEFASQTPVLMKIDAEGFETEVLNGAENLLAKPDLKAIIIELNGSGGRYNFDEQAIDGKLRSLGFIPHSYNPENRKLTPLKIYQNFNTIYIRDPEFVRERIRHGKAFLVFHKYI